MRLLAKRLLLVMLAASLTPVLAVAHDASTYGGVFRSRAMGASWLNADVGLFLNAALVVAVDPHDPNHLLMGADSGLFSSSNGGRSWTQEASALISGSVFAIAFSPDGSTALCAAPGGVFRFTNGTWLRSDAPAAASPGRGITFGEAPDQVYLLGRERIFSSTDAGRRFAAVPSDGYDSLEALAVQRRPSEAIFAIAHGRLIASTDGGRHWQPRSTPGPLDPVDIVIPDPAGAGRIWAAVADRLYVSGDSGETWTMVGNPLPEARTTVRGIAADAATLVVTTHRGTYRSTDAGMNWTLQEGNLPVHLEAGPLARDPSNLSMLYVVYSLIPYPEVWRSALDGSILLARIDTMSLIGGLAFLLLLLISGILLVVWLTRMARGSTRAAR